MAESKVICMIQADIQGQNGVEAVGYNLRKYLSNCTKNIISIVGAES